MTGVSGTGRHGVIHQYYQCVTNRKKGGCKKKTVKKGFIEDLVVTEIINTLTDDYIDDIACKISELSAREGNTDTVKRLRRLLKENETATANLIKAIEAGKAVDILSSQIEKRQLEKTDLETQIAKEKLINPVLAFDEVKFFFEKFKHGDVNSMTYRMTLIDTFVSRIYLYDGDDARLEIFCHASEKGINIPIGEPTSGSPMGQMVEISGIEPLTS